MLNVIINNESIKKSYIKTQRILSKYLPQYGQRTYCGSISKEGLENLYNELKSNVSKYVSISCLLIKNKHNTDLLWILGNKDNFDLDSGVFAIKTKSKIVDNYYIESDKEKFFNNIIKISALFHDLGKTNQDFQNKLKNILKSKVTQTELKIEEKAEIFRHEVISLFLVDKFFNQVEKEIINNKDFIFNIDNIKLFFDNAFNEINNDVLNKNFNDIEKSYKLLLSNLIEEIKNFQNVFKSQNNKKFMMKSTQESLKIVDKKTLIKLSIYFLVLTHHKIIGKKQVDTNIQSYEQYFCNEQFINDLNINEKKLRDNFTFKDNLPQEKQTWLQQVEKDLNELYFNNININDLILNEGKFYLSILTHYCRPFLVFSDYLGSVLKTKNSNSIGENIANLDGEKIGDNVVDHLMIVRKSFLKIKYLFNCFKNKDSKFKCVENFESKKLNELIESKTKEKFQWQNDAYHNILKTNKVENHNFTVIISETGSGKTLGGVKIMKAISRHKLRFNLCLGLRTLTLQSGTNYRNELGFNDSQLGVIIGSSLSQKIYKSNLSGSDVFDDDEEMDFDYQEKEKWLDELNIKGSLYDSSKLFEGNTFKIINSPIVVCTVDQLIGITNLNKVSKARLIPRIFSSDLILDEIDNYSPKDLIHVSKLIYLFGMFGRKVIIMSATVSSVIIENLYNSYKSGIEIFNYINEKESKIDLNLISNLTKPINLEKHTKENIEIDLKKYINNFIDEQKKITPKTKLKSIIPVTEDWKNLIYKEVNELHNLWKNKYTIDGKKINLSIGFVKFNNVNSARELSYKLLTESDKDLGLNENKKISILCYHSKYLPIELNNIEKSLQNIINRKNNNFLNSVELKELVKNFSDDDKEKDLTIIICTTSIIEVGRDHDYDWAIIEPTTNKGLIQTVGRILRHRENNETENRFSILDEMIKAKKVNSAQKMWKNSGVFNYLSEDDIDSKEIKDKIKFEMIFDINDYNQGVYSSIMFKENNLNFMKTLEDKSYIKFLEKNDKSIKNYIERKQWLNNYHYFNNKFRKKEQKSKTGYVSLFNDIFNRKYNKVKYNYDNKFYYSSDIMSSQYNEIISLKMNYNKERVFLKNYYIEELIQNIMYLNDFEITNLCTYEIEYFNEKANIEDILDYHPLLGFNYKKLTC